MPKRYTVKMTLKHLRIVAQCCLAANLVPACTAAIALRYVGAASVADFRSTAVAKPLDADQDNVFGTGGYVFYGTDVAGNSNAGSVPASDPLTYSSGTIRTKLSLPTWLSLSNNGQNRTGASYPSYPFIDDPALDPAPSVADVQLGVAVRQPNTLGAEGAMADIRFGQGAPATGVRVGVVCFAGTADAVDSIRLAATTASATATRQSSSGVLIYFFDVTGAQAGDAVTLYLTKNISTGGNANLAYVGLTFDVLPPAVPPFVLNQSPSPSPVTALTQISITFSKAVQGVDAADLLINGVPATNMTGALKTYLFQFPQPTYGTVLVSWSESHGITDTLVPPSPFDAAAPGSTWQYQLLAPPRITFAAVTNSIVTLSWASYPGMRYSVEFSSNLLATNWTAAGGEIIASNAVTSSSQAATNERRFYRVGLISN